MIRLLTASVLASLLTGLAFTCAGVWPRGRPRVRDVLLAGSLAVGLGLGLSACSFFLWLVVVGRSSGGVAVAELALLICAGLAVLYAVKARHRSPARGADPRIPDPAPHWLLGAGFCLALGTSVLAFFVLSRSGPHGGWDAWMTWNLLARFMFRGGDHWTDAFSPVLRHADYPLLVPGIVARSWAYLGNESALVPALVGMLFTFATVGLATSSLAILRTRSQGLLAGLVLLGTQFLIVHGASQYADVPLGFFFLATVVLLCLQDGGAERGDRFVFLAGLTTGLAAWTKNEGLLFLAAILAARCAVTVSSRGWKACLRELQGFAIGAVPILAIVVYFKTQLAPPNDLLSGQGLRETLERLADIRRYLVVLGAFKNEVREFGSNGLLSAGWLLLVYLICLGVKVEHRDKPGLATAMITLGLMVGGYMLALLTAPDDFQRLVNRSVDRVLLQLWPSAVFAFFLIAATPEEAVG